MRHLNVNQLICLLALARGTLDAELNTGTRRTDLQALRDADLVKQKGVSWELTDKGSSLIDGLKQFATYFTAGRRVEMSISNDVLSLDITPYASRLPAMIPPRSLAPVGALAFPSLVHGDWTPEADDGKGLKLSDVEDNRARLDGGSFFVVAEASVEIEPADEGSDADFKSIRLAKIDPLVHNTEEQATEVAVDRAKAQVGSRHVVLKGVAIHEVAVPIKSRRL